MNCSKNNKMLYECFSNQNKTLSKQGEIYRKKCKRLRYIVKKYVFENAAICDQIAFYQEKTAQLTEEMNFLYKKLQQYELNIGPDSPAKSPYVNNNSNSNDGVLTKKSSYHPAVMPSKKKQEFNNSESIPSSSKKQNDNKTTKKPVINKHKKLVKSIPIDSFGRPVLPISLATLTIHSLGEVIDKADYHTEDLIYPVGYYSTRIYGCLKDPEKQCLYTCKISESVLGPKFEIIPDNNIESSISNYSIDECHSSLLRLINVRMGTDVVNTRGRGSEFFGLSHPIVHYLIQSSPGARKCKNYVWTKFEVSPNHDYVTNDTEASLSFNALKRSISFCKAHLQPAVTTEPVQQHNFQQDEFTDILL